MAQFCPEQWIERRGRRSAERQFYDRCHDLGPDFIIIHDIEWHGERPKGYSYYQNDFLIIHPDYGILLVEVKGGKSIKYEKRQWIVEPHQGEPVKLSRSPLTQAYDGLRAFLRDLQKDYPEIASFIENTGCHAVCFPDIDISGFDTKTLKAFEKNFGFGTYPEIILDRGKLSNIEESIYNVFAFWKKKGDLKGVAQWTPSFVEDLKKILAPTYDWRAYLRRALDQENSIIEKLSDEQSQVWYKSFTSLQFAVPGCAGSGKTLLAIMLARAWSDKGLNVLVCCFNRALADWLKRSLIDVSGVKVSNIHQLWREFFPSEEILPKVFSDELKNKIKVQRKIAKYDAIIIDEAQDFHYDWWMVIDSIKLPNNHMAIFYDDNQNLYRDAGRFPWKLPAVPLTVNFRTTQLIHHQVQYFHRCGPGGCSPIAAPGAPKGEPVYFQACATFGDMIEECYKILTQLRDGKVQNDDIVILAPNDTHFNQIINRLSDFGVSKEYMLNTILLTTIYRFKGLERKIVIALGLDASTVPHYLSSEVLYVSYSRARLRLYVLYNSELSHHYIAAEEGRRAPVNEFTILLGLNEDQIQAVKSPLGVSVIRAGAGSGKTQVLTRRIAYLIDTYKIDPSTILAVTFTNKAARELRDRLQGILPQESHTIMIGTFHSVCVQLLRKEIPLLPDGKLQGRDGDFKITNIEDYWPSVYKYEIYGPWINEQKNLGRTVDDLTFPPNISSALENEYTDVFIHYHRIMEQKNAFDFHDLLSMTVLLFEQYPAILSRIQRRWKYILVDEFQDTNQVQFRLIDLIYRLESDSHRNLTVVGDAQQAIYGWRGADYTIFRDIADQYPDAEIYELKVNYRSIPPIIDAAHSIASDGRLGVPPLYLEAHRDKEDFILSTVITDTVQEEIDVIAKIMQDLVGSGEYKWSDIVILLRSPNSREGRYTINVIQSIFPLKGIPYHTVRIESFQNNIFVKTLTSCLRLIDNPYDNEALSDWLCTPLFPRIDQATVTILIEEATRLNYPSVWEFLLKSSTDSLAPSRIEENLRMRLVSIRGIAETLAARIYDAFSSIQAVLSLREALLSGDSSIIQNTLLEMDIKSRISSRIREQQSKKSKNAPEDQDEPDNGYGMIDVWRTLIEQGLVTHQNIRDAIDMIYLSGDSDMQSSRDNKVFIQTIHSAKGLEFPIVFILGFEQGVFPFVKATTTEQLQEEARVCYVALTRAKDHLIVSMTKNRMYNPLPVQSKGKIWRPQEETLESRPSEFLPIIQATVNAYQEIAKRKTEVVRIYRKSVPDSLIEILSDCVNEQKGSDIAVYLEGADEQETHQIYHLGNILLSTKQRVLREARRLGCNIVED